MASSFFVLLDVRNDGDQFELVNFNPSWRTLGRSPSFLQSLLERLSGVLNVLLEKFARGGDVALAAEFENLVVFFVGALNSVGEIELQARVALAAVVHVADDSHEMRALGA